MPLYLTKEQKRAEQNRLDLEAEHAAERERQRQIDAVTITVKTPKFVSNDQSICHGDSRGRCICGHGCTDTTCDHIYEFGSITCTLCGDKLGAPKHVHHNPCCDGMLTCCEDGFCRKGDW